MRTVLVVAFPSAEARSSDNHEGLPSVLVDEEDLPFGLNSAVRELGKDGSIVFYAFYIESTGNQVNPTEAYIYLVHGTKPE